MLVTQSQYVSPKSLHVAKPEKNFTMKFIQVYIFRNELPIALNATVDKIKTLERDCSLFQGDTAVSVSDEGSRMSERG